MFFLEAKQSLLCTGVTLFPEMKAFWRLPIVNIGLSLLAVTALP
jgi:hypothetical protein